MAKNKMFDGLFGEGAKQKKLNKKLQNLKKDYQKLDAKLMLGKLSQKELTKYYSIKEEIIKMTKKFTMKDGKLVLNAPQTPAQVQPVAPVQPVQASVATTPAPVQLTEEQVRARILQQQQIAQAQQIRQQQIAQAQHDAQIQDDQPSPAMILRAQQIAAEESLAKEAYVRQQQELQRQEAVNEAQIKQHMAEYQAQNADTQLEPTFEYSNQPAKKQAKKPQIFTAEVSIVDLPNLKIDLEASQMKGFETAIRNAMITGEIFPYLNAVINGSKIIMYRINTKE